MLGQLARAPHSQPASEHIIDLILEVRAQTCCFEPANARREHEWRVWQKAKLPEQKILMPGVVSHATNLIEHPQLVADRILRYTAIAGRENVVAGLRPRRSGPRRSGLGQTAPGVEIPLALDAGRDGCPRIERRADPFRATGRHATSDNGMHRARVLKVRIHFPPAERVCEPSVPQLQRFIGLRQRKRERAIKWTRLSCRTFAANAVRLQLYVLAHNLGNVMRTLAMPKAAEPWSLTSVREKLIKIGADRAAE